MTVMVPMHQTLVMPLQNGTQKEAGLGPDFRRDDGRIGFELSSNSNKQNEVSGK